MCKNKQQCKTQPCCPSQHTGNGNCIKTTLSSLPIKVRAAFKLSQLFPRLFPSFVPVFIVCPGQTEPAPARPSSQGMFLEVAKFSTSAFHVAAAPLSSFLPGAITTLGLFPLGTGGQWSPGATTVQHHRKDLPSAPTRCQLSWTLIPAGMGWGSVSRDPFPASSTDMSTARCTEPWMSPPWGNGSVERYSCQKHRSHVRRWSLCKKVFLETFVLQLKNSCT